MLCCFHSLLSPLFLSCFMGVVFTHLGMTRVFSGSALMMALVSFLVGFLVFICGAPLCSKGYLVYLRLYPV